MAAKDEAYCPKSDEGVKSAVKPGALVVGIGSKATVHIASLVREALGKFRVPTSSDDWEGSKVNHLVVVVECNAINGDCCEAANKFMRQVRGSDGYGVYSDIIKRHVAVLALGKMGKVAGASKVADVLAKRGGCKPMLPKPGRADADLTSIENLGWIKEVADALDALNPPPPPECRGCEEVVNTPAVEAPAPVEEQQAIAPSSSEKSSSSMPLLLVLSAAAAVLFVAVARRGKWR